ACGVGLEAVSFLARLSGRRVRNRLQRFLVIPLREKQLTVGAAATTRGPRELSAIRRRHWQPVESVRVSDTNGLLRARGVDDEEFKILKAQFIRGEDEIF